MFAFISARHYRMLNRHSPYLNNPRIHTSLSLSKLESTVTLSFDFRVSTGYYKLYSHCHFNDSSRHPHLSSSVSSLNVWCLCSPIIPRVPIIAITRKSISVMHPTISLRRRTASYRGKIGISIHS